MTAELHATLDFIRERVEREHGMGEACPNDTTRHSPDDTGGFVLRENLTARFAQSFTTVQAIAAHAGHDDPKCVRAKDLGDGAEERIGRRTTRILRRSLVQLEMRAAGTRRDDQMVISRREPDVTWTKDFTGGGFRN